MPSVCPGEAALAVHFRIPVDLPVPMVSWLLNIFFAFACISNVSNVPGYALKIFVE